MVCIYCGASTSVTNSRLQSKLNRVWRRRRCNECNSIFTTLEAIDEQKSIMVLDNESLTPFSLDKLFISIYESCRHQDSAANNARALTDTVLGKVLKTARLNPTITKQDIQRATYKTLQRFDNAAAVHYKAYYYKN